MDAGSKTVPENELTFIVEIISASPSPPVVKKIGNWIYTPGEGSAATGGFKSTMFGGIIEWNPTNLLVKNGLMLGAVLRIILGQKYFACRYLGVQSKSQLSPIGVLTA